MRVNARTTATTEYDTYSVDYPCLFNIWGLMYSFCKKKRDAIFYKERVAVVHKYRHATRPSYVSFSSHTTLGVPQKILGSF